MGHYIFKVVLLVLGNGDSALLLVSLLLEPLKEGLSLKFDCTFLFRCLDDSVESPMLNLVVLLLLHSFFHLS